LELFEIIWVIFAAALRVGELRVAIPVAMITYDFTWFQAAIFGLIGNLIPVLFIPWILHKMGWVLLKLPRPIPFILELKVRSIKTGGKNMISKYGRFGLIPFVAIPLPFTGAWSGILAAWIFDIHPKKAIPMLTIGVIISGTIVTTLMYLGISIKLFSGEFN